MLVKKAWIFLVAILLIGLFFRSYRLVERFGFAHDADLYSWIVKDIYVNNHLRLVGQVTSSDGIFIGPLYYYALIPFFYAFNMDPIGSAYFTLVIGILTILSYYFVFSRIFSKSIGIIAAFLHAVSWSTIGFDRWMVPTITTKLWAIWYLYVIVLVSRGKFRALPLLAVLIALIWHVHLALLPTLLAIPVSLALSKKLPTIKQGLSFVLTFIVASLPLALFEIRHGFIQFKALLDSTIARNAGKLDLNNLQAVLDKIADNTSAFLLSPIKVPEQYRLSLTIVLLLSALYLVKKKLLLPKEVAVLYSWVLGVILYFTLSPFPSSEYYFANLEVIFMLITSLLLMAFLRSSVISKAFIVLLLGLLLARNLFLYLTVEPHHVGYVERKQIAEYIAKHSKDSSFPCVAINYITYPGENVGFRYFFYLNNLKLAPPSNEVPVYSIVFPYTWSKNEVSKISGDIGVIPPAKTFSQKELEFACSGQNTNLTDPMFGYVE